MEIKHGRRTRWPANEFFLCITTIIKRTLEVKHEFLISLAVVESLGISFAKCLTFSGWGVGIQMMVVAVGGWWGRGGRGGRRRWGRGGGSGGGGGGGGGSCGDGRGWRPPAPDARSRKDRRTAYTASTSATAAPATTAARRVAAPLAPVYFQVFGQVVRAREALGADRAPVGFDPGVRALVTRQLIRSRETPSATFNHSQTHPLHNYSHSSLYSRSRCFNLLSINRM